VVPHLARAVGPDFPARLDRGAARGGYPVSYDTLRAWLRRSRFRLHPTAVIGTPFFIWLLAGMQRTASTRRRDLTIGYSDHGRAHLNVALATGEALALLGPEWWWQTTLLDTARHPHAASRRCLIGGRRARISIGERARLIACAAGARTFSPPSRPWC
jgi:hypothetical protein